MSSEKTPPTAPVDAVVMRCESCGGTSSVPRHGLNVCATCLHGKAEVRLMGTDAERHNAWVEELKADVEFEPLRDFLDRLKE